MSGMKYKQFLICFASFTATFCSVLAGPSVKPAGMKIVWEKLAEEFNGYSTYGSDEGVEVSLVLQLEGKSIIAFDDKKSKIAIHYGDKNLGGKFRGFEKYSKDRLNMRIEARTKALPSGEGSDFKLTGSMAVTVASKSETKSLEAQKLKQGDKLTIKEGFDFEVSNIGKPKYGKDELEITLKWKRDISQLAAVKFYNKEGELIESRSKGWSKSSKVTSKTYSLKKKFDEMRIEMDFWTDAEILSVPIDLKLNATGGK